MIKIPLKNSWIEPTCSGSVPINIHCALNCNRPCLFVCLFVGPPYYSQRAVSASPLSAFYTAR